MKCTVQVDGAEWGAFNSEAEAAKAIAEAADEGRLSPAADVRMVYADGRGWRYMARTGAIPDPEDE